MAIQNNPVTLGGMSEERLLDLLYRMMLIRAFEDKAAELYNKGGKIGGFLHLYSGQEAVAVGLITALAPQDLVLSSYREHGHALAKGSDPNALMAELCGKATGVSHGKGGSMHIFDHEHGILGGYAIVGAQMPLACGYALASKMMHKDQVIMCFFGDGAVDEGAFHEAMNLAQLWSLPIVFVCENNMYSMGNALAKAWSVASLEPRAAAYGMAYESADGMDLLAMRSCGLRAIERAREASLPTLIEAHTYRFRGHSMADPANYRPKEEVEAWKQKDPIPAFGSVLLGLGVEQKRIDALEEEAQRAADDAADFAEASPAPEPGELMTDIMVDSTGAIAWRYPR